jgi:hypothetical protein
MQTNREDCGGRHVEVILPKPKDRGWADSISANFRAYFTTIAEAKADFVESINRERFEHVANVATAVPTEGNDSFAVSIAGDLPDESPDGESSEGDGSAN